MKRMRRLMVPLVAFLASCTPIPNNTIPARAANLATVSALPPMKTFANRAPAMASRPNSEIAQDFLDLAFRMESGRAIPVMTRFDGPISVRATGATPASLGPDLRRLLGRIRSEAGIDIFYTTSESASITIHALPRAELQRAVPSAACFVVPRVSSWEEFKSARRSPQVDWTTLNRRDRVAIFVPSDTSPQELRDCLHEELAQALGPLNDLYRLPDSVFNDDNIHAVLTPFDMLILRAYYAPELSNGMTRGNSAVQLPRLLSRINPAGDRSGGRPSNDTSRDWIEAMEAALANGASPAKRRASAATAVGLARAFGWDGSRRGFAHFAFGRLQVGNQPEVALASFKAANNIYAQSSNTRLHSAHVAVQLAAFSLSSGDGLLTLELVNRAIPVATHHENAALLATLMMFRAEALELTGRIDEARQVRLDSLGWARYGFGSERNVRARLREVQELNPFNGAASGL
jgi:hypothetical protein